MSPSPPPPFGEQLRDVAILEVAVHNVTRRDDLPWEIAVAYLDGRPTRTWLVAPAASWDRDMGTAPPRAIGASAAPGGEPPQRVAAELAAALLGCRVHTKLSRPARTLLRSLYAAVPQVVPPPPHLDLAALVDSLQPLAPEIRDANNAARSMVPYVGTAASAAERLTAFIYALVIRVDVRQREARR